MQPQFFRSSLLVGAEGIASLNRKKVAIFGIGGVGSFAVEALARGGVGSLLLVDNDTIDITNINRQLPATLETVGSFKTKVMADRIKAINPDATVITKELFCLEDNLEEILDTKYDYIIDAVDTVSAKLAIAEYGYKQGIPVISCMGAGNKLDPTQFQVADINTTSVCPLCRVIRRELKARNIPKLKVVYSMEPPLTPDYTQLPKEAEQSLAEGTRRATPGSMSFVPPVAGFIAAGEVIKDLLKISR